MRALLVSFVAVFLAGCSDRYVMGEVEFQAGTGTGEPYLYATKDGRAVLTWLEPTAEKQHALRLAVRGPEGWSDARTVVESDRFFVNWADFPSFTELADGSWAVHWLQKVAPDTYAYHVMVAISRDDGATWSDAIVPHSDRSPTEHGFVSMMPFGDGVALVWLDGREMAAGEGAEGEEADELDHHAAAPAVPSTPPTPPSSPSMQLRFTTISSGGDVPRLDLLIDERTCECCQTALARTNAGLVAAYRDRSPAEIRNIGVAHYVDGRWSEPQIVADDHWYYPGCPVNGPQLATAGDSVAVAWYTAPEQQAKVQVAFSTDGGTTWGQPIRVDDGDPLGRVDIQLQDDGAAIVVWLERREDNAAIRARRVTRGRKVGKAWTVAQTAEARASGFPHVVRVGDELLFAWTVTGDDGGVRVAAARRP